MIFRNKRDSESWVRELTIDSMKSNPYLIEDDFVEVASSGYFFRIVKTKTDIQLLNGLYAELQPFDKCSKEDFGVVKIGKGLDVINGVVSHPDNHFATDIITDEKNRFVTEEEKEFWNNKISKEQFRKEIDYIVDKAIKGATWKPPIPTFKDIDKFYPEPKDTWTTITMDTNMIYMYNEETKEWKDLGKMLLPNFNFNNLKPSVNKIGGIDAGTVFDNVPIIQILNDVFYKKTDVECVPEFYIGVLDDPMDFDFSKYTRRTLVKFPLSVQLKEIKNKYINFVLSTKMNGGDAILPTDIFVERVSEEIKTIFSLSDKNIELEEVFDIKIMNIKGESYLVISSKEIMSGTYEFLINRDKNKTLALIKALVKKVNELESIIANK